jgi:hypothetical protein
MTAGVQYTVLACELSVHDDDVEAFCELERVEVARWCMHLCHVEQHQIGLGSDFDHATILEPHDLRRNACRLVHCLFDGEHTVLAHIAREQFRVGAGRARMTHSG